MKLVVNKDWELWMTHDNEWLELEYHLDEVEEPCCDEFINKLQYSGRRIFSDYIQVGYYTGKVKLFRPEITRIYTFVRKGREINLCPYCLEPFRIEIIDRTEDMSHIKSHGYSDDEIEYMKEDCEPFITRKSRD